MFEVHSIPARQNTPDLWLTDGSLRDVYFLDTSAEHWEAFIATVSRYPHYYLFDGEAQPLPSVASIFSNREGSHLLSVVLGKVQVNCHFFVIGEIELDIDPREVAGNEEHGAILEFIAHVSSATGIPALLTPESAADKAFLSFDPATHVWSVHDQAGN